jgi:hypothetical protein
VLSEPVARYLLLVFDHEGYPTTFQCDNGKEFMGKAMQFIMQLMGSMLVHGLPYNPQCQGLVERKNGVAKTNLYKKVRDVHSI